MLKGLGLTIMSRNREKDGNHLGSVLDFKGNRLELDGKDDPPVLTGNNKDMTPSSMTQDVSKVGSKPNQIIPKKLVVFKEDDDEDPS